jgi:hypothetical protein
VFPDDENGDVLWRMHDHGDNMSKQREIDFCVIFPTEESAMEFAAVLLKNGQKVSFSAYEGDNETPRQVLAHPIMQPTYDNITGFELLLGEDAARFGGPMTAGAQSNRIRFLSSLLLSWRLLKN